MTIIQKLFALKSTPPFDRLRDSELALIAEVARYRHYAPGETVCSPTKRLTRLHIVVAGSIEGGDGAAAPRVSGVEAMLFERPVTQTWKATAPEGAHCLLIQKGSFFTMMYECPSLAAGFLEAQAAGDRVIGAA